ncbi:hypothetical protein C943_04073 [Mariniradius saccharolyticus AK6]|uniref:Uncharacterized protein n=1 Tax=Mariniradius saccharolyticus AK6 TaxID=1239962 RepID=M7XA03_9BACT|nr:hypothetical protein C943_04073 [Mariniradius saccharolyticus AK6]
MPRTADRAVCGSLMGNKKIFFATNGHIFRVVQMTGKFDQIKIQKK